jgi:hypothetical protein
LDHKIEQKLSTKVFFEIYYKEFESINPEIIREKAAASLKNLLDSDRFRWIATEAVKNASGWIIEPPGYGETRIQGMKAYCKVDFLFPVDGEIYIADWKTGQPDEFKFTKQLVGYAAWARYHLEQDPERIHPIIVHLYPEYSEKKLDVNEFDIEEFAIQMQEETEEMYQYCVDVGENIPVEKDRFPMTGKLSWCRYCHFKALCNR